MFSFQSRHMSSLEMTDVKVVVAFGEIILFPKVIPPLIGFMSRGRWWK